MSVAVDGAFWVGVEYDTPMFDKGQVRAVIEDNRGEVCQDETCEDCRREIVKGRFVDRSDAQKAVEAFQALGIQLTLFPVSENEEESNRLVIQYPVNSPWIVRDIASLLTPELCRAWKQGNGDETWDGFCVDCWSVEAARYLKWQIEDGPLDRWVNVYYCANRSGTALNI